MPFRKPLRPDSYVQHTLLRYGGGEPQTFKRHVLLSNFRDYAELFKGLGAHSAHKTAWEVVHSHELDCSLICFGIGSPMAGMVMHCLGYLDHVDSVIMLGLAGGLADEMQVGDFVLPTASIRDEGTSRHYLHADTPALPNFKVQHAIAKAARDMDIRTRSGIFKTTDYRMWEFDERFARVLKDQRVVAIDMEISALFSVGYALGKPVGAIMVISDLPLVHSGIKRSGSTSQILEAFGEKHLQLGIQAHRTLEEDRVFEAGEVLPFEW